LIKNFIQPETSARMFEAMKSFFTFNLIAIVALGGVSLAGCTTGKQGVALDTVGPSLFQPALSYSINGTLVVFSAYDSNPSFINRNSRSPVYSDYNILTKNGRPLERVHNNTGTLLQDPVAVELPSGKYQVIALANGYGRVTIPVVVEAGRTTMIHLEGGGFWPDESLFNETNAVRLPDGLVVGWRYNF
jgi:hypothetical protein